MSLEHLVGRTITAVETDAFGEEYVVLDDGTGLFGYGDHEDGYLDHMNVEEVQRVRQRYEEAEERQREAEEEHRAWMALTCEQRAVVLAERERSSIRASGPGHLLKDEMAACLSDFRADFVLQMFGQSLEPVKRPCPHCRELECPNAPMVTPEPIHVETSDDVPKGSVIAVSRGDLARVTNIRVEPGALAPRSVIVTPAQKKRLDGGS